MAYNGTVVRVQNVHKEYRRGSERIDVLQDINLEIPPGDFLALMGPSGSGKTTLLNLMGGLDTPTGGSVDVNGVRINELSGARLSKWRSPHVGFVFPPFNPAPLLPPPRHDGTAALR